MPPPLPLFLLILFVIHLLLPWIKLSGLFGVWIQTEIPLTFLQTRLNPSRINPRRLTAHCTRTPKKRRQTYFLKTEFEPMVLVFPQSTNLNGLRNLQACLSIKQFTHSVQELLNSERTLLRKRQLSYTAWVDWLATMVRGKLSRLLWFYVNTMGSHNLCTSWMYLPVINIALKMVLQKPKHVANKTNVFMLC
jgi:hypothetical protein